MLHPPPTHAPTTCRPPYPASMRSTISPLASFARTTCSPSGGGNMHIVTRWVTAVSPCQQSCYIETSKQHPMESKYGTCPLNAILATRCYWDIEWAATYGSCPDSKLEFSWWGNVRWDELFDFLKFWELMWNYDQVCVNCNVEKR